MRKVAIKNTYVKNFLIKLRAAFVYREKGSAVFKLLRHFATYRVFDCGYSFRWTKISKSRPVRSVLFFFFHGGKIPLGVFLCSKGNTNLDVGEIDECYALVFVPRPYSK